MASPGSYCIHFGHLNEMVLVVVLALLSPIWCQLGSCGSRVEFLPGFQGPLPFVLETGYVSVEYKTEKAELFYYFVESEKNPEKDPLLLWLDGGPGCSGFSSITYQFGPLAFKTQIYNGSLPTLELRSSSWTKVSSIIYIDSPAGTGFSYSNVDLQGDLKTVHHVSQFIRKWLIDHPKFLSNDVYIGGLSYSGITLPPVFEEISKGNEAGVQPWINLQGYLLGDPVTYRTVDNYRVPFTHGMGLISDELYESLQKNCRGDYANIESTNVLCLRDMQSYHNCISGIFEEHILEPVCETTSPKPLEISLRRSLTYNPIKFFKSHLKLPPPSCRTYPLFLSDFWANDPDVRKALHIRKGSVGKLKHCNYDNLPYQEDIIDSFQYHDNLSRKGYRSLIYSGDHDLLIPFLDTQAWIRSLNYSIVDDWRQWYTNGQVAGK